MKPVSGKKSTQSGAEASFAVSKDTAIASVKALHVLLCQEDGAWSAQGVEIDYAACGNSVEEATKNFVDGLAHTVVQHLLIRGNLDKVLKWAPKEVMEEWLKTPPAAINKVGFEATAKAFEGANIQEPQKAAAKFPFDGFQFIQPEPHTHAIAA